MKSLGRGPSILPSLLTPPRQLRTSFFTFPLQPNPNFETYTNYWGFPSRPISIYHIWVPWPRLTEPEVYRVPKESRPICKHPITAVWRQLGQWIYGYLDSIKVKRTRLILSASLKSKTSQVHSPFGLASCRSLARDDPIVVKEGGRTDLQNYDRHFQR